LREQLFIYSQFNFFENWLLGTHVTWHDAYSQVKENISKFNHNMQNKHTNEFKIEIFTSTKHMEQ
jgi:hypothetical protein